MIILQISKNAEKCAYSRYRSCPYRRERASQSLRWFIQFLQTLGGSFSAVSTATIATKYSFFQDFRDLQDFHTFAPLRSQNFSKKPSKFLPEWKWNFIFHSRFSMKSAIFRRKFDENFPEFRRNCQEMTKCLEILRKSVRKIWKMLEISRICEKFSFFISFFHSSP